MLACLALFGLATLAWSHGLAGIVAGIVLAILALAGLPRLPLDPPD